MRVKRKEEPEERSSLQPNTAGTPQLRSQGSPAITQAVYTEKKKQKKKAQSQPGKEGVSPLCWGYREEGGSPCNLDSLKLTSLGWEAASD